MKQISFLQDIFNNKDTETFLPCLNEFHLIDIIKEGDDGDEIFVLEEGKIEVYYTEDDGSE